MPYHNKKQKASAKMSQIKSYTVRKIKKKYFFLDIYKNVCIIKL